jgi:hypothetical protein
MSRAMRGSKVIWQLIATALALGCRDRGPPDPNADELARLSPEVFSHADEASAEDARCLGAEGILISATSIGPVRLGRTLQSLRQSCPITQVKVPATTHVEGPVLGISASGGLILFTVAGNDSAVTTAGTSSPGFRASNGVGVGSVVRETPARAGTVCFKRDSGKVDEVFISRRPLKC